MASIPEFLILERAIWLRFPSVVCARDQLTQKKAYEYLDIQNGHMSLRVYCVSERFVVVHGSASVHLIDKDFTKHEVVAAYAQVVLFLQDAKTRSSSPPVLFEDLRRDFERTGSVWQDLARRKDGAAKSAERPLLFDASRENITQLTSLSRATSNFVTHRLVHHRNGLEFRRSKRSMAFGLVIGVFCVALSLVKGWEELASGKWIPGFGALLFGLGLGATGLYFARPVRKLFHREKQCLIVKERIIPFTSILALQLLSRMNSSDDSQSYETSELNVLLNNGERVNLICHSKPGRLREHTLRICELVGCKFWESTAVMA